MMQFLDKTVRSQLEKTVREARRIAVEAARHALQRFAVDAADYFTHMTEEQRRLRTALRARGRQLGDARDPKKETQEIDHLAHEVAYEAWHRLLFTRFLAENRLLLYRDHPGDEGVPVTLQECDEIARELRLPYDGFELAARLATDLLPQIFRRHPRAGGDDPVLEVPFAPEDRRALRRLVLDLPAAVFQADDSLGWVYQFWQADEKDCVNASEVKIGADELPAVTQLFTEDYMVRFLLENTLGAWWVSRHPDAPLPVAMPYLRRLDRPSSEALAQPETSQQSHPRAGGDPEKAATTGGAPRLRGGRHAGASGHDDPVQRMGTPAAGAFPGWPDRTAGVTVLDPCMGSGHFLVAALYLLVPMRMQEEGLSARDAVDAVLRDNLFGLELDLRCTQIAAFALALAAWTFPGAGGYRDLLPLNLACSGLAPEGDLDDWLKPAGRDDRLRNGMSRLYAHFRQAPTLGSLLDPGKPEDTLYTASSDELRPVLEEALAREDVRRDDDARERGVTAHGLALAAGLLTRRYTLVATNVPYLSRSKQDDTLRQYIDDHFPRGKHDLATAFVERALDFVKIDGTVAMVAPQNGLFLSRYKKWREHMLATFTWNLLASLGPGAFDTISGEVVNVALYVLIRTRPAKDEVMTCLDASDGKDAAEKDVQLQNASLVHIKQANQRTNPDRRVLLVDFQHTKLLRDYADSRYGLRTADSPRFILKFWELPFIKEEWVFHQSTVLDTTPFGGRENILLWSNGSGPLKEYADLGLASLQGGDAWGEKGIAVSLMGSLPVTLYSGDRFDNNCAALWPHNPEHLPAIWAFCASPEYQEAVRQIDNSLKVTNLSLLKVPFDLKRWQKVAEEEYPNGLPKPYSDDPTQWIFHGHPAHSEGPSSKVIAPLQVAVARLVGYRWPAEQDATMELSDEARALVAEAARLNKYADEDGIVCLPAVAGERPAADRLRALLAAAYNDAFTATTVHDLVAAGVKSGDLERWLRDKFFEQHCQLFQQRPFVWHVWDGERDGFAALVNYHRLDYKALEKLAYTYLGAWLRDQEAAHAEGDKGAERRLYAARELQKRLRRILEGESPYDIFVRWKPLHEQPIGWQPDLNDGVRVNIRPFVEAGVLRKDPKINWKKDRGKNPPGAPWGEVRRNDLHTTLTDKREAREKAGLPVDA